jgi:uncharacterized protein YfaT (DUF1175 family)
MCALGTHVTTKSHPFRSASFAATSPATLTFLLWAAALGVFSFLTCKPPIRAANLPVNAMLGSRGDGFPDGARLDNVRDRANFTHWFTFLAESQFYAGTRQSKEEVQDCAALIRYALRNALAAHTPAWRENAGLPYDPGFGDVSKYHYPDGPLGRMLFRAKPGPARPDDLTNGAFVEFADSATLLRFNTYRVSRDLRAAAPGDLLFFHQDVEREPFHSMLFVGKSYYQQAGADWIVYHTGDIDGRRGVVREVETSTLLQHPDFHWRPIESNPHFLGVYRLEILR